MSDGEDLYVVDWHSLDIADEDDTSSSSNEEGQKTFECQNKFVVKAFCIDTQGHTVVLNIHDFNPYYYVKVPNDWTIMQANMCAKGLKGKVKKWHSNTLIDWKLINAKPLYGFTANDKFRYLRLTFTCLAGFYAFRKILTEPLRLFGLNENRSYRYELYESNLHPLLRFMHCNNLQAVGWLNVKEPRVHFQNTTTCKRELSTSVQAITPIVREDIPPITYMGFDIEADSSHGDFPLANKDYQKLARDIITDYCLVRDERLYSDMRPILATYLRYAFHPYYNNNNIRSVKLLEQKYPSVAEILSIVPFETVSGLNQIIEHWLPCISQILQSDEEDQVAEILDILEFNFPAIDIETSDYYSCSAQLVKEYKRLCSINDEVHQAQPMKVTKTLLEMMFDPYYNNLNINHIYNKRGRLPSLNMCKILVPSINTICEKAYTIIQADRRYIRHRKMGVKKKKDTTEGAIKVDDCVQELRELFNKSLPEVQDDRVIQIGSTIKKYGETDCYMKHIICLNNTENIDNRTLIDFEYSGVELPREELLRANTSGLATVDLKELNNIILTERKEKQYKTDQAKVIVECYDTEEEVLLAWARLVSKEDPDIVVGYNTFGFDYKYLYDRAEQLGILDEFSQLGRIKGVSQQLIEKKLQSAGLGDNLLYIIEMHGRISIDLYKVIQKMYQLNSYKLDSVCKQFLYKAKVDVSPAEIFVRQKGSAADRRSIAEYCLIDCILCIRLMDKMELIINNIGMAQVCSVPLSFLFLRGQGIKLFSFVAKICREKGNLIAVLDEPEDEGKYEGAIVLEPDKGIHNEPVVVADFNSLYPSCMISENLSHNSFVGYKIVKKGASTDYRGHCLTNNKYERNLVEGLYPGWDYADIVYDMYKEVPVAAGKKKLKKIVSGHKICRFAQPPNGEKDIIPTILMDLLSARKKVRSEQANHAEGSFKFNIAEGLQLAYKVTANSLYGIIGASTSPIRCREIAACTTAVGRKLIHFSAKYVTDNYPGSEITYGDSVASYTPILINQDGVTKIIKIEDLSHEWRSEPKPGSDKEVADLHGMNIMSWTESGWTKINCVIRHKLAPTKKMFRVLTHTGLVDVTSDHSLLRPDGTEVSPIELKIGDKLLHHAYPSMGSDASSYSIVEARIKGLVIGSGSAPLMEIPDEILNGSHEIREAFWDEFSGANNGSITVNKNQMLCAQLSLLADSLGISLTLDGYEKGDAITGLHELEYDGYVYDLTTTNHHFQAGIGRIIVHNTDSIFCKFVCKDRYGEPLHGLDAINKSILLCTEASMLISKQLKKPHNLEFEKAILPFILLSKKRYHGHYYKSYGSSKFSAQSMGIVLKRRDNAPIVKHIFGKMIDIIMEEQSIDKALEFVKTECDKVLRGEFPLEMFIIAKTLRSYYKKPDSIAHNVLAQRIGKRDPGNKPRGNDRIAYAFIVNPNAVLQGDMIETPEYIIKHGCKIDYGYYITHQVAKPVLQIFELAKKGDKLFDDLLREHYSIGWKKIKDYDSIKIYTAADFKIRNLWSKKSNTDDIFGDETTEEEETDTEEDEH